MKGRIFDIISIVEKMPQDKKDVLKPQYTEFFDIAVFLDDKLATLAESCPADWSDYRKEIESKKNELKEKINYWDAEHIPGGYVGG